jgi:hypothetical protein
MNLDNEKGIKRHYTEVFRSISLENNGIDCYLTMKANALSAFTVMTSK